MLWIEYGSSVRNSPDVESELDYSTLDLDSITDEDARAMGFLSKSNLEFIVQCAEARKLKKQCDEKGHPNASPFYPITPGRIIVLMWCPDCKTLYSRGITNEDLEEYYSKD